MCVYIYINGCLKMIAEIYPKKMVSRFLVGKQLTSVNEFHFLSTFGSAILLPGLRRKTAARDLVSKPQTSTIPSDLERTR